MKKENKENGGLMPDRGIRCDWLRYGLVVDSICGMRFSNNYLKAELTVQLFNPECNGF